jgi:hypothetical protein
MLKASHFTILRESRGTCFTSSLRNMHLLTISQSPCIHQCTEDRVWKDLCSDQTLDHLVQKIGLRDIDSTFRVAATLTGPSSAHIRGLSQNTNSTSQTASPIALFSALTLAHMGLKTDRCISEEMKFQIDTCLQWRAIEGPDHRARTAKDPCSDQSLLLPITIYAHTDSQLRESPVLTELILRKTLIETKNRLSIDLTATRATGSLTREGGRVL